MNSSIFSLNAKDFAKGAVVAVATAVIVFLAEKVNAPGFDFTSFDWSTLITVSVSSFLAYLTKNFLSDDGGKVLGMIG